MLQLKTLQGIIQKKLTNSFRFPGSELNGSINFDSEHFYYDKGKYLIPFTTSVGSVGWLKCSEVNYFFVIKDNQIVEKIYKRSNPFFEEHAIYHKNLVENNEDKIMECIGNYSELQLMFLPDQSRFNIKDEIKYLRADGWIDLSGDLQI